MSDGDQNRVGSGSHRRLCATFGGSMLDPLTRGITTVYQKTPVGFTDHYTTGTCGTHTVSTPLPPPSSLTSLNFPQPFLSWIVLDLNIFFIPSNCFHYNFLQLNNIRYTHVWKFLFHYFHISVNINPSISIYIITIFVKW